MVAKDSIFKAYDIRGIYGEEIDEEGAYLIGRAFAQFLKPKRVAVGHDMRTSSPALHKALIRGLTDQGADVINIGLSTTPMMYFAVAKFGYDAGINITASHNPGQYNGMKMVKREAVPLSGETGIQEIKELVAKGEFEEPERKGTEEQKEILPHYVENILSSVDTDKIRKFKIVVDTGNGMGGLVVPELFKKLPCELIPMYLELDGNFPNHVPNPLEEETLTDIKKRVAEEKADLGIALDGDADRIFFIDENGKPCRADLLGARIAEIILKKHPGSPILYDLRSSRKVREVVEEAGGKAIQCRVGHSFIKAQMREEKASFALELSAHYYMADNYYIESPFILTLLLLKRLSEEGKTLSELIKPLETYYASGEINSKVQDKDAVMEKLEKEFSDAKRIFKLDGLSVEYDDWWFNVRPSNTEPLLRLNLEAETKEKMEEMKERVLRIIRS
ncbi:phosphomannomutase/phosphoglucomutase [Candidatus Woesearchaeota archaeon]|nr:MAG: phosphomannomutase/phosphoglucomutase [Candidatus Woesearchaeota archaeon]